MRRPSRRSSAADMFATKASQANKKRKNRTARTSHTKRCFCFGLNTDDVQRSSEHYVPDVFFFSHVGDLGQAHTRLALQAVAEATAGFSVTVRTSSTLQTDPLPISPASRSLCKANNIAESRLKNESVSTAALLSTVADHFPSLYLDGAAFRYSLCPYRSIWGTSRNYTRRRPKTGLYAEIVCRQ